MLVHSIYSRGKKSEILQYFQFSNFTLSSKPIMKNSLVYFLFKKTNKYLPYVVDDIIFGISVPDYPSRTVESNSLRSFWNFSIFCLLYTVDAGYKNPSPIYRIICILFIEFSPDIRTFHAGYKNIPDIRALYWKTVAIYHTYFMPIIRTCS